MPCSAAGTVACPQNEFCHVGASPATTLCCPLISTAAFTAEQQSDQQILRSIWRRILVDFISRVELEARLLRCFLLHFNSLGSVLVHLSLGCFRSSSVTMYLESFRAIRDSNPAIDLEEGRLREN